MATMGMPSITISFNQIGIQAIERSQRGIIAMVLHEATPNTFDPVYTIYSSTDIPETLSAANKQQIELALMGYKTTPYSILVFVVDKPTDGATTFDYSDVLVVMENNKWDYLVIPEILPADTLIISTWIKDQRTQNDNKVKAVLPNTAADDDGVINFVNTSVVTALGTFTAAQYCSRIAGIICGTPMTISCTYAPLAEVISCDMYTKADMDKMVGEGKLFIFYDGEKFKVARGINSLITLMQGQGSEFQKIKLMDLMDMIHDDIKKTAEDYYIGKYANSYDNKCLLISAIKGYFMQLELQGLLEPGQSTVDIDIPATRAFLTSIGVPNVALMKDQAVREANTRDQVFLVANIVLLDAIEAIQLAITI